MMYIIVMTNKNKDTLIYLDLRIVKLKSILESMKYRLSCYDNRSELPPSPKNGILVFMDVTRYQAKSIYFLRIE